MSSARSITVRSMIEEVCVKEWIQSRSIIVHSRIEEVCVKEWLELDL